jgi:hypothetical protein
MPLARIDTEQSNEKPRAQVSATALVNITRDQMNGKSVPNEVAGDFSADKTAPYCDENHIFTVVSEKRNISL